ncbi:MAG: hypothetical protein AAF127_07875 [Pseudomonadota bacterium]
MGIQDKAKTFGSALAGFAMFGTLIAVGIAFLVFAAEFSVWALAWIPSLFAFLVTACVLILLPLSLLPKSRFIAAIGLQISAQIFGLILLIFSMAFVYMQWGLVPVIVGLIFGGIGPIPIAVVAAIIEGQWGFLGNQAILFAATLISAVVGGWLSAIVEKRALERAAEDIRATNAIPARRLNID